LLVLDLLLPNMNGFEIVNRLRQNDTLRTAPLVVYSVQELDEEKRESLRLGQTLFFTKSRTSPSEFEVQVLNLLHKIVEVKL
jgi:CheY-like chemotaxis protein